MICLMNISYLKIYHLGNPVGISATDFWFARVGKDFQYRRILLLSYLLKQLNALSKNGMMIH